MRTAAERLAGKARGVADLTRTLLETAEMQNLSDDELTAVVTTAGRLLRAAEALLIEASGEVTDRSVDPDREQRFTTRHGCGTVNEFFQRATGAAPKTVARWGRMTLPVRGHVLISGGAIEPALPAMREALGIGRVGLDGIEAVCGPLMAVIDRADPEHFAAADAALAQTAWGSPGAVLPEPADLLRVQAVAWARALDPDGAEPSEMIAAARRGLRFGRLTGGVVPIRGELLPEVAAQFRKIADALGNPRAADGVVFRPTNVDEAGDPIASDHRSRAQQDHDALATALLVAASSARLPSLGGAAPVLVVHIEADAFTTGEGTACIDGDPVPLATALHVACSGAIQRITTTRDGRILRIGTEERVFNRHQRRAIALRDGGCVIPGCGVRAEWCEIHHVEEHARGGPTHTDNGVLLCWFHHRFLDHNGWRIRMREGVPEVSPPRWLDGTRSWRPARPPGVRSARRHRARRAAPPLLI